jgi:large subunit ribosomal protein L30
MAKKDQKKLKITQTRSLIGQKKNHKRTIEALGLKRIRHTVIKNDTPQIRGMINKVVHMVKFEEVDK